MVKLDGLGLRNKYRLGATVKHNKFGTGTIKAHKAQCQKDITLEIAFAVITWDDLLSVLPFGRKD